MNWISFFVAAINASIWIFWRIVWNTSIDTRVGTFLKIILLCRESSILFEEVLIKNKGNYSPIAFGFLHLNLDVTEIGSQSVFILLSVWLWNTCLPTKQYHILDCFSQWHTSRALGKVSLWSLVQVPLRSSAKVPIIDSENVADKPEMVKVGNSAEPTVPWKLAVGPDKSPGRQKSMPRREDSTRN